ncbi:MAG: LuxR C-terminal-related transcriptional regulator [Acidobacteriota bacterium]
MSTQPNSEPIRIGVLAGEPVRLEGLRLIFAEEPQAGLPMLVPVMGVIEDLLADRQLEYLVVDLNSSADGLQMLETVRRARPGMRQIVIGPPGDDELVIQSIVAGARAYLDSHAAPQTVRQAIDIVVSGSIWAPRRLLSTLIDRLLDVPGRSAGPGKQPKLTQREIQILERIKVAKTNTEIAAELGIEKRTVKAHVGRLIKKMGVENRIALSIQAARREIDVNGQTGVPR